MLKIKIFGLEDSNSTSGKDIKANQVEELINDWLINNQHIEVISTNVSSGGGWTSGEKYYILYKETSVGNDADEVD